MGVWSRVAAFLVVGYLCMTRSFAYLGIVPLKIFIGEIVLATFLFLKPRVVFGTWAVALERASPLSGLALVLLVFVQYGVWQVARGVLDGGVIVHPLKLFIFNYYPLFLFLGIWVGLQSPDFLRKLVRVIAWVNGIYGLLWVAMLRHVDLLMPGVGHGPSGVLLFGQPVGSAVAVLGLCCFERNLRSVWPLIVLNIMVTLVLQWRTEWLGLALGMLVWGLLARRLRIVIAMGVVGLVVLGMVELTGVQLSGRTSEVSISETLARVIAPIDVDLAKKLSPNAALHAHTVEWREKWWEQIWLSVHSTPMLATFGHGYGFDLFDVAPQDVRSGQPDTRTPHNIFYFAVGYTGWIGVGLFGALQLTILRLLWRSYRVGGQAVGIVWWVMGLAMALFEASFDTPYRAIPFYLLWGMAIAPGLQPNVALTNSSRHGICFQ